MKNNKTNTQFITLLFIVLALFVGAFLVTMQTHIAPRAGSTQTSYTKITGDGDLDRASADLNNIDLNSIDKELNRNNQDASSF